MSSEYGYSKIIFIDQSMLQIDKLVPATITINSLINFQKFVVHNTFGIPAKCITYLYLHECRILEWILMAGHGPITIFCVITSYNLMQKALLFVLCNHFHNSCGKYSCSFWILPMAFSRSWIAVLPTAEASDNSLSVWLNWIFI